MPRRLIGVNPVLKIRKRIVIVGATSAIAQHCARLWIRDSDEDLTLIGRDKQKTERVAEDLRIRSPQSRIHVLEANFVDPLAIRRLVDGIVSKGDVHIVLIAHGLLPDQRECQEDLFACRDALLVNGVSPVLFAEAFVGHMQKANSGHLAIIGSVAGDRGRRSNYVYGAGKGLIERYTQGLQHRLARTGVKVILVKPGPTDTPMAAHWKQKGNRLAKVEEVARLILEAIEQGKPRVYAPRKWALIMLVIRNLPNFIFNRLDI